MNKLISDNRFKIWIVIAGFLLSGVNIGISANSNVAFYAPVSKALGVSVSAFSATASITSFVSIPFILLIPVLLKKFSNRQIVLFSGMSFVLIKLLFGLSNSLWQMYVCSVGLGLCLPGIGYVVINSLINDWFHASNGKAMGMAASGAGIVGAIVLPIINLMIQQYNWRWGYFTQAIIATVMVLAAVLLIQEKPNDTQAVSPHIQEETKQTASALRSPSFYFLMLGLLLILVIGSGVQPYLMIYLTGANYSSAFAASAVSAILLINTFAKIIMGAAFDKAGATNSVWIIGGSIVLSLVLMLTSRYSIIFTCLFVVAFAFAYANMSIPAPFLTQSLYGRQNFSGNYSIIMAVTSMGGAIGNYLTGFLSEQFGSYDTVWYLYIAGILMSTVCLFVSCGLSKKGY
ncbi:Sugar phosphate permease [Acetanaerobacterium elongatum]|uniref:Sugar phosphate permease n=2 Tax=Acetanaerobacterium elongatum TaxID=258515 RepID=A0A1H0H103_9FIRM|nr:Sugar phosphate permease [Acetanaerobacterium elongatum]